MAISYLYMAIHVYNVILLKQCMVRMQNVWFYNVHNYLMRCIETAKLNDFLYAFLCELELVGEKISG